MDVYINIDEDHPCVNSFVDKIICLHIDDIICKNTDIQKAVKMGFKPEVAYKGTVISMLKKYDIVEMNDSKLEIYPGKNGSITKLYYKLIYLLN